MSERYDDVTFAVINPDGGVWKVVCPECGLASLHGDGAVTMTKAVLSIVLQCRCGFIFNWVNLPEGYGVCNTHTLLNEAVR